MTGRRSRRSAIWRYEGGALRPRRDHLATEEPLEMRLMAGGQRATLGVTMRTPGDDFELAAGFALSEGIVTHAREIGRISYCVDRTVREAQRYNIVNLWLRAPELPDLALAERRFSAGSACGICGAASLDALEQRVAAPLPPGPTVSAARLCALPGALRGAQGLFERTGGLHAAALFTAEGDLLALREDVGRHNALDKLLGWALMARHLPLHGSIVLLSGRASYELTQKALMAGVPIVCAISAPSSLAVSTARRFGMTLVGFLRGEQFNVYAGAERIVSP